MAGISGSEESEVSLDSARERGNIALVKPRRNLRCIPMPTARVENKSGPARTLRALHSTAHWQRSVHFCDFFGYFILVLELVLSKQLSQNTKPLCRCVQYERPSVC